MGNNSMLEERVMIHSTFTRVAWGDETYLCNYVSSYCEFYGLYTMDQVGDDLKGLMIMKTQTSYSAPFDILLCMTDFDIDRF